MLAYVMFALLHRNNPGHVIECDSTKPEVGIVRNLVHFLDKRVKIEGLDAVDGSDEVCGGQAILVGRRTSGLEDV